MATEIYPDIYTTSTGTAKELETIAKENAARKSLYAATYHLLRSNFSFRANAPSGQAFTAPEYFSTFASDVNNYGDKLLFVGVYGLLRARNQLDPSLGRGVDMARGPRDLYAIGNWDGSTPIDATTASYAVVIAERFVDDLTQAVKDFYANRGLFERTFPVVLRYGTPSGSGVATIFARQLAEVVERLAREGFSPADPYIDLIAERALSQSLGATVDGRASAIDVSLPDLDAGTSVDIVSDNVRALAAIYFSAQLEEMKLYAVVDKVVEHFMTGMLPISRGPSGDLIYEWIRNAPDRFNEIERRSIYGRALGLAQGATGQTVTPNREFSDLWVRFLSNVVRHYRETAYSSVATGGTTVQVQTVVPTVAPEAVHKSGRDLAVNLSLHGYGVAHFAAIELQTSIRQMISILSGAEMLAAYGVTDHWQLVERVSALYLGGATNGVRYRTMASSGGAIITWLADNTPKLTKGYLPDCAVTFRDSKLVSPAESWLAVTGTTQANVEKYAEPVDLQQQSVIPSMMPSGVGQAVRGMLDRMTGTLPNIPQA